MYDKRIVSRMDNANTQMLYFTCSSLSADDKRIYLISDRDGSPNVYVHDLQSGEERRLTANTAGAHSTGASPALALPDRFTEARDQVRGEELAPS